MGSKLKKNYMEFSVIDGQFLIKNNRIVTFSIFIQISWNPCRCLKELKGPQPETKVGNEILVRNSCLRQLLKLCNLS